MGADLYIESITDNLEKPWESEEGYFRDSYNGTNLLWTLGLSWWQDIEAMLNDEGYLTGENIIKLIKIIEATPQKLPETDADLAKLHLANEGEDNLATWQVYFIEKRQRFLAFLNRALQYETPICCSI